MINFKKRLEGSKPDLKVNPIELYDTLDRASDKGPLRPSQYAILEDWHKNYREDKDSIIKLHTGQGKTLIGLLILQSRLNEKKGSCIYICPNIFLANQTCIQAQQFGIPYCVIGNDRAIPKEFLDGEKILITHSQIVFNGKSKFGLKNKSIPFDSIVLDDSHSCIETIEDSFTVKIHKTDNVTINNTEEFDQILNLLEGSLEDQGYAKLQEIKDGDTEQVISVPYWIWKEKYKAVTDVITANKDKESSKYKFAWDLIKDEIENCFCLLSGDKIEIRPYRNPIEKYGSFYNAKCRIFMSATTNNDSFFIKGLGLKKETVLKPIVFSNNLWSGEKMILVPFHIDDKLDRMSIIRTFGKSDTTRKLGVIALTSGFHRTKSWENAGATVVTTRNISEKIEDLIDGRFSNTLVFANRYDGIDLPDSSCRLLIVDSKPYSETLYDRYQEDVRLESDVIDIKIAQKIEQGLGRGVRGEKDYCVIYLIGSDILSVVTNDRYRKFFSEQTQMQIRIGLQLTRFAVEDATTSDGFKILVETTNQCLKRDNNWKDFYKQEMDSITPATKDIEILQILELEKQAEDLFSNFEYQRASNKIQELMDKYIDSYNDTERGWYLQQMARMMHPESSIDSNKLQVLAHKKNKYLFKPSSGMQIKKLSINEDRIEKIKKWIKTFSSYLELKYKLEGILGDLIFGASADKFEMSLEEVGKCLGFESERPEKYWKEGPDNLWCISKGEYILFECKNEVDVKRAEIVKKECGQMSNSCHWFDKTYVNAENVTPVMIINTRKLAKEASMDKRVKIMKKNKLTLLHRNIKDFFSEFNNHDLNTITSTQVTQLLVLHKLEVEDFKGDLYFDNFV